jgi:methionine-rich copper-binding protein CopC
MRWTGLLGLVMLAWTSPASAHALLERASPPVGSEVATSPSEISLSFTEGVEPLFSMIELHGPDNAAIPIGKPHIVSDNNRRLVVELPKLSSGTYRVIWHVTSVDTHKTEGDYRFTVTH